MADPIALAGPAVTVGCKLVDLLPIIWLHLGFLVRTKKHIEDMMARLDHLTVQRDTIQEQVDANRANGAIIRPEVEQWLQSAAKTTADACTLQDMISSTYLNGCHINFCTTYKLNKKAVKISKIIDQLLGKINIGDGLSDPTAPSLPTSQSMVVTLPPSPPSFQIITTPNFMAFPSTERTMRQIIEALADKSCDLVGVIGMGGVGKTTIAEQIGKRASELGFVKVMMVTVSQNVDMRTIQGQIAKLLELELSEGADERGRAGQLCDRISRMKDVLIILDDVWTEIKLASLGISPEKMKDKRCKIMVTTRREKVCTDMGVVREKMITVGVLSRDESWELFREISGADIDSVSLKGIANEVIQECGCLPLALVVIGKALHGKPIARWEAAKRQLKNSKPADLEKETEMLYNCLKFSYDFLEGDEVAKSCFLMCCLFPEDYYIDFRTLTIYAHGKGSFRNYRDTNTIAEVESLVYVAMEKLKESSLLLGGSSTMGDFVRMHDVVRDVGIYIASDMGFLIKVGAGLTEWPDRESFDEYTCISLMANDIKDIPENLRCPKLEVLSLRGNERQCELKSSSCFDGMTTLRLLDLSLNNHLFRNYTTTIVIKLPTSLKCLTNLRTLLLDYYKFEGSSLSIVGELKSLEILSLRGCEIVELPTEIGNLSKLRSLNLANCEKLRVVPANVISRLSKLEELPMTWSFNEWAAEESESAAANNEQQRRNANVSELVSLHSLKVLVVSLSRGCSRLDFALPNLEKFIIYVGKEDPSFFARFCENNMFDGIPKPLSNCLFITGIPFLEPLLLRSLLPKVHRLVLVKQELNRIVNDSNEAEGFDALRLLWIVDCDGIIYLVNKSKVVFANLQELRLVRLGGGKEFGQGSIKSGSFENLKCLQVGGCSDLIVVIPRNWVRNLHNLEKLEIEDCRKLKSIIEEDISEDQIQCVQFPNLKSVKVTDCGQLRSVFSVTTAQDLQKLEELYVRDCPEVTSIIKVSGNGVESENNTQQLTSLRELRLSGLPNLRSIYVGPKGMVNFSKLVILEVGGCRELVSIFPPWIARNLEHLQTLGLRDCSKLKVIFAEKETGEEGTSDNDQIQPLQFPSLRAVKVTRCGQLTSVFSVNTGQSLRKLEELSVLDCPEMNRIIEVSRNGVESGNITQELTRLRHLRLGKLPNLRSIYVGPQGMVNFSKLVILEVVDCPEIDSIFPPYTSRSLEHLQTLSVRNCSKLKLINIQPLKFPNLESVKVTNCGQLASVFNHVTTAQSLQELKKLKLAKCDKLVHVIDNEIESEASPKSIEWPHLLRLEVRDLPSFRRFCPSDYTVNLLSLEELHCGSCNGFENLLTSNTATNHGLELRDSVELRVYSESDSEEDLPWNKAWGLSLSLGADFELARNTASDLEVVLNLDLHSEEYEP